MKHTLKLSGVMCLMMSVVISMSGCGSEVESKNMEQIYAEEGVPVVVEQVEHSAFTRTLEYSAMLTGLLESSAHAAVADKIDKILFRVGDVVEKDAVVLTFPTDNPSANYYQAKVSFENARASFDRMTSYYEAGGLSRQDYDNAMTQYEVAKADWDAVRQSVMVKAPIAGVVTRINVRESENVEKEDELFAIAQTDRLKTRIWVSDDEISDIKVGQTASARWNDVVLTGTVVQADMSLNLQHQAFGVVLEFDNRNMAVRSGITATVGIETYRDAEAIVVAWKDVTRESGQTYVYIVDGETAVRRPVTIGRRSGIDVEIVDGLRAGETLVTGGQMNLADGRKIRIVDSFANASAY